MNQAEDLDKLHKEQASVALSAMNQLRMTLRYEAKDLKSAGYKTVEEAVVSVVKYNLTKLDGITKMFLQKHPD